MAKNTPVTSKPPKKMRVQQVGVKKSGGAKRKGKKSSLFRRFVNSRTSVDSSIQNRPKNRKETATKSSTPSPADSETESEFEGFSDPSPELGQAVGGEKGQEILNYFLQSTDETVFIVAPCKNLTHAGDELANFFNTNVESAHEDDALRGVAALIYWVRHQLSDSDNRYLIAPARHPTKSPLYQLHRSRVLSWQSSFQSNIMNFYKMGVFETCNMMAKFFENADQAQRLKLWSDIFDLAPMQMAKASLTGLTGVVPIDEIYSWDGDEHKKWRQYIKGTFVFAADDTYRFRFKTGDKGKTECFDRWLALPNHPAFAELGLDDIDALPIKAGGLWDQGRRRKVKKLAYTAAEQLPDV